MATFPTLDFNKYIWRTNPDDPSYHYRCVGGGELVEDIFNRFSHGEQNLFLGVTLRLSPAAATPPAVFVERARKAWAALRHTAPTIAARTEHREDGATLLTYRVPKDDAEVTEWAARTVLLEERGATLDDLRFEIGKKPIPAESGDQTFVHVLPLSDEGTSYGLLLYTSHIPFDGAGTKGVMNAYLAELAKALAGAEKVGARPWGPEADSLLPYVTEILAEDEPREGPQYTETLAEVMGDLAATTPKMYGFKQRNVGPGPTRRLSHTFELEESTAILERCRSKQLTVNHLAHAAVFLVCTHDNPPDASTPPDAVLMNYGLVNARARLRPPYNARNAYTGYCLGMSPIFVPVSQVAGEGKGDGDVVQLAGVLKEKYARQRAYPALLAIEPLQVELMVAEMMKGPPPPPWMGPWYSGDGRGEDGLDYEFTAAGDVVVSVEDFFTSLNKTNPGPFFRTWSWKGRLTLSADYNETAMPREVVQGFVDKWVEFVRAVL